MTRQEFMAVLKDYCHNYEEHMIPDPYFTACRATGGIRNNNQQCPITFVQEVHCSDDAIDSRGAGHYVEAAEALGMDYDVVMDIVTASDDGYGGDVDYDYAIRQELLDACKCSELA